MTSARATVWRWRLHFQRDFQARMDWCIRPFKEANHNPIAAFDNKTGTEIIELSASSGERITLDASGSTDPDKDSLSYHWFVYPEAGTIGSLPTVNQDRNQRPLLIVPNNVKSGDSIHVILEVTDGGIPSLTSYRRIVVTII